MMHDWINYKELAKKLNISEKKFINYEELEKELQKKNIKYIKEEWDSDDYSESQNIYYIKFDGLIYQINYYYWNKIDSVSNGYEIGDSIEIWKE